MRNASIAFVALAGALLAGTSWAHHPIGAKFDETKPLALTGIVTLVDWRNPHVHVFVNVATAEEGVMNWAVELPSPVTLEQSGWTSESLRPGDAIAAEGIAARDGTRQIWGETLVQSATGRKVLYATVTSATPPREPRPTPRWPDGTPRLSGDASGGFWSDPDATVLVEKGVTVAIGNDGLLRNVADASKVAPLQPWALGLYEHRQRRQLRDDPLFLNCKPPGGVRYLQSPFGFQFVEDRERERIFMLLGGGNHNYRIIYLDGREQKGQVDGDDDNPLYYGRAVARWDGDTLVVETTGFNEDFWFTNGGLPHTDKLRLTERFSRPDYDTLRYEVTVEDPGAYTRPWSSGWDLHWVGGEELPAYFCQDNRS
jgi:Family of unknown function (DUF6152)